MVSGLGCIDVDIVFLFYFSFLFVLSLILEDVYLWKNRELYLCLISFFLSFDHYKRKKITNVLGGRNYALISHYHRLLGKFALDLPYSNYIIGFFYNLILAIPILATKWDLDITIVSLLSHNNILIVFLLSCFFSFARNILLSKIKFQLLWST